MEKAIAVENLSQLEKIKAKEFSRVYFGSETCQEKMPSKQQVSGAKQFCQENKLAFSLMTPFCTDAGIARLIKLFPLLSTEDEIIANDFGVLTEASKQEAEPVVGRLLNKQFRDPRIVSLAKSFSKEMVGHLALSQASVPGFRKILSSFRVKRVGLDNLLQGVATNLNQTGFSASLYFPLVFIAGTRMCLAANCGKLEQAKSVGIFDCGKECLFFKFKLSSKAFPKPLLLLGNGLFFENNNLPSEQELLAKGINRIVFNNPETDQAMPKSGQEDN